MTNQALDALEEFSPDWVIPPGETIAELLADQSLTQKELAERMGSSTKFVNQLIAGKATLSEDTALKLEKVLGAGARFWINLESQYREGLARISELEKANGWTSWLTSIPVKDFMKAGILRNRRINISEKPQIVLELLKFFGVASPQDWEKSYGQLQLQFRRHNQRASNQAAVAAWLRLGELEAQEIETEPYNKKKFRAALDEIRGYTVSEPREWQHKLVTLCAQAGVALAFVPSIPKARVSGVARWLSADKALIQLSLYGKTNDKLWFTFFHEAAHILFHPKKEIFLDDFSPTSDVNSEEMEANNFARDFLIPQREAAELRVLKTVTDITSFANRLHIHPGIVVGRLQHDKLIGFNTLNHLKDKYEFVEDPS